MAATKPYEQYNIIRKLRARGISENDVTDDSLLTLIDLCLDEYLFYKPNVCITSSTTKISTVADQPNYDKPTGALWIIDVCWNPDYGDDFDDIWKDIVASSIDSDDTALLLLDYRQMSLLHKYFGGAWTIRNDQIWLIPAPSAVYQVAVIYAATRTLDELDEIADKRFFDLIYYMALDAAGTTKLTGGGWKAGQYQVSESVGRETKRVAQKGLEDTRALLANAYRGIRS